MREIGFQIGPQRFFRLHGAISNLRKILPNLHINQVISRLIQKLLISTLIRIYVIQSINRESDQ